MPIKKNRKTYILLSFLLGFISIISQVLLLRELITVFYGNEIAYAIILASWLFWVSLGSFTFSALIQKIKNPQIWVIVCLWVSAGLTPLNILLIRHIYNFLDIPIGEIIGILPMCLTSFILLAPLTTGLGATYALLCRLSAVIHQEFPEDQPAGIENVSSVYLWEAVGSAIGGILFSYIFVRFIPALHLAVLIVILECGVLYLIAESHARFLRFSHLLVVIVLLSAWFSGGISGLDQWSRRQQWPGYEIVCSENSIYGQLTLLKREGEYSLFQNGLHSFSTNDPLSSEESVHFPLLLHQDPRQVLLIGNGMGGGLKEILKYAQAQVAYVELDPKLIEVAERYLPEPYTQTLHSDRVKVHTVDARYFVKRTETKYDVIIINLSDPYTALINRYYTLEFFQEAQRLLKPNGMISLSVSSSENYLDNETREFLRSINSTLKHVFPDVESVPGDTHIFIAANQAGAFKVDPELMAERLKSRQIDTLYVQAYYLPFRLSPDRMEYIKEVLREEGMINTDNRPIAYLFDIIHWSLHFNTRFKNFISQIRWIQLKHLMLIPLLILMAGLVLQRYRAFPISLSIMTTGFSEIIYQVIVILAFQTLYGYAYYKIGLIVASFMAGLVFGVLAARRVLARPPERIIQIYKYTQLSVCLYPLCLPFLFVLFRDTFQMRSGLGVFATVFSVLPVTAGFIGGLQYPLAVGIVKTFQLSQHGQTNQPGQHVRFAGFLYALDVLGATIGALLAGTIFIPLLGISAMAFFCAALNFAVWILLLRMKG